MQALTENVKNNIQELRNKKYSCSQATLLGLNKVFGSNFSDEQLKAVSVGFLGGIGRTFNEGTCGALSGGTIALGIFLPNKRATTLTKDLFNHFKKDRGTVICGNMVKKTGFHNCTECCLIVGTKVSELLIKEKEQGI